MYTFQRKLRQIELKIIGSSQTVKLKEGAESLDTASKAQALNLGLSHVACLERAELDYESGSPPSKSNVL